VTRIIPPPSSLPAQSRTKPANGADFGLRPVQNSKIARFIGSHSVSTRKSHAAARMPRFPMDCRQTGSDRDWDMRIGTDKSTSIYGCLSGE
jgi:hypothetical protein